MKNKDLIEYEYEAYRGRKRNRVGCGSILAFLITLLVLVLALIQNADADADSVTAQRQSSSVEQIKILNELAIQAIVSQADLNKPASEPITYADWFIENAQKIENCKITHYCCELYPHICGTGDGITATGTPVIPYWTCAVDKSVIPYGSEVLVDYGDGTRQFFKAQDCGGSVKGNHIDLAVERHEEAETLGIKYATIYFLPEGEAYGAD